MRHSHQRCKTNETSYNNDHAEQSADCAGNERTAPGLVLRRVCCGDDGRSASNAPLALARRDDAPPALEARWPGPPEMRPRDWSRMGRGGCTCQRGPCVPGFVHNVVGAGFARATGGGHVWAGERRRCGVRDPQWVVGASREASACGKHHHHAHTMRAPHMRKVRSTRRAQEDREPGGWICVLGCGGEAMWVHGAARSGGCTHMRTRARGGLEALSEQPCPKHAESVQGSGTVHLSVFVFS